MNGMIPPPKNQRWAIPTDCLNQLNLLFRELPSYPGSGVAVNDEKRRTDIAYLVTDEGYPPKILIFAGIGLKSRHDN